MVRAIVGTMVQVGLNKMSLDEFRNVLIKGDRKEAGASVPAHALFLTKVEYHFLTPVARAVNIFGNSEI